MNKSRKNIECEIRGPLTWSDFCELKEVVEKDFGRLKHTREAVIFFIGGEDVRMKITSGECFLVFKRRLKEKNKWSKIEREIRLSLNEAKNALLFLDGLGFRKALFSYCNKYEISKNNLTLSFKFDTQIGDFFEIEKIVKRQKEISQAIVGLSKIAKKYNLTPWGEKEYEKIKKEGWKSQKEKPVLLDGKLNPYLKRLLKKVKKRRRSAYPLGHCEEED